MKTGRVDCLCGGQIMSNIGKFISDDQGHIICWSCGKKYKYDHIEAYRIEGESVIYSMKIFKMNEYDWWMDIDLESAKDNYTKHHLEIDDIESLDIESAKELTYDELDKLRFIKDEDDNPECSFREHMNELDQTPQFFASTEY